MGRRLRPQLPGVPFHLTARVQACEHLLLDAAAGVATLIREAAAGADARVVAYAVMSNHIHLVVVQGARPLMDFMQPLLRRIALRVHATHGREDHVFGKPYADRACLDADHLRNTIAYVHLNPVRAGVCGDAAEYAWSSHRDYCDAAARAVHVARRGGAPSLFDVSVEGMLRLFAQSPDQTLQQCCSDYLRFIDWRLQKDRFDELHGAELSDTEAYDIESYDDDDDDGPAVAPRCPDCSGGDSYWLQQIAAFARRAGEEEWRTRPPREDLRDVACRVLATIAPELTLEVLRSGGRGRPLVHVRRQVIARCLEAGHATSRIARFLRVSDTTVSRVATAMRSQPANPAATASR